MGGKAMKRVAFVLTALVLLACGPTLSGNDSDEKKVSALMLRKLDQSQKLLEGVVTKDFKKIAKCAEELIAISKEAEWKVLKTPHYEMYSNDFRRIAESLIKNAEDKNLDAAALSYVELTLSCVKCHKHVREVRMTRRN
jgi:hypothetical protein